MVHSGSQKERRGSLDMEPLEQPDQESESSQFDPRDRRNEVILSKEELLQITNNESSQYQ